MVILGHLNGPDWWIRYTVLYTFQGTYFILQLYLFILHISLPYFFYCFCHIIKLSYLLLIRTRYILYTLCTNAYHFSLFLRLHTMRLPSGIHGLHTYTHIPQDGCHLLLWCVFLPAWLWGEGRLAWGSGGLILTQDSVCQYNLLVKEKHEERISVILVFLLHWVKQCCLMSTWWSVH